jgi:SecD/SecF fusion protein
VLVIALVVLAPVGVACSGRGSGPTGEVVLRAVGPVTHQDMQRAAAKLQDRLDRLHVRHASVRQRGRDQLIIELPRRFVRLGAMVAQVGELAFYDLEADATGPSSDGEGNVVAESSLFHLLKRVQHEARKATPSAYYLFDKKQRVVAMRLRGGKAPKGLIALAVPEKETVVRCVPASGCPGVSAGQGDAKTFYYLFRHDPDNRTSPVPEETRADLKRDVIKVDSGTGGEGNVVRLAFTSNGNRKFHQITRAEAARGQAAADAAGLGGSNDLGTVTQFAQHFAIVLDGELKSTPYIDYKQNPDGINPSNGGAEISNIGSFAEARGLSLVLQTGALPAQFVRVR